MFNRGVMHVTCDEFDKFDSWKYNNGVCANCLCCDWSKCGNKIYLDEYTLDEPEEFLTAEILIIIWDKSNEEENIRLFNHCKK